MINAWKFEVVRAGNGRKATVKLRKCWKKYAGRKARYSRYE